MKKIQIQIKGEPCKGLQEALKKDARYEVVDSAPDLVLYMGSSYQKALYLPLSLQGQEVKLAKRGGQGREYFVGDGIFDPFVAKIATMAESGELGAIQAVDYTVNAPKDVLADVASYAYFTEILFSGEGENESVEAHEQGYLHGFWVKKQKTGRILRCSFTAAPDFARAFYRIYGTKLEIRSDNVKGETKAYPLVPDHKGDNVPYDIDGGALFLRELAKVVDGEGSRWFCAVQEE